MNLNLRVLKPAAFQWVLVGPVALGLFAAAPARADNFTAYNVTGDLIEAPSSSGATSFSASTRYTAEGPSIGSFADYSVLNFSKADFGLNFAATSFSNLNLNLTDRFTGTADAFPVSGSFDVYYTLDTATNSHIGSTLRYTGNVANNYPQGINTDGQPVSTSANNPFASPVVFLGTQTYTRGTTANVVDTISLSSLPSSVFLDALNGTNGSSGLRLILAPHDNTVAADFYGYSTGNGSFRPNLTFSATLNQPLLAWKTGSGTWLPAGSSGDTSWNGGPWDSSRLALFGGTAGTVNLSGAISATGVQFDSTGYTVTGAAGSSLTLTGSATVQVTNAADTATISGVVAGANGLTKIGAGSLVLGNAANTYSGATTITSGALVVNADGNLGAVSNAVVLNGGTLRTGGAVTLDAGRALSGSGTLDLSGGALTVNGTVNAGTLNVINGAATLVSTANVATVDVRAGASLGLTSGLTGSVRTFLQGDGSISLGDSSGFTAGVQIAKGSGTVGPTVTLATGGSLGSAQTNLNAGALQSGSDISIANAVSLGGNATIGGTTPATSGAIEFAGAFGFFGSTKKTLTINVTTTILSAISPSSSTNPNSSLNKDGLGRLILASPANAYNGGTTVTGGTLQVNSSAALGTGSVAVTAMAVAHVTLEVDNDRSIDDLSDVVLTSNGSFHGRLDLEFAATDAPEVINSLAIDGKPVGKGTYLAADLEVLYPGIILGNGGLTINNLSTVPEPSTYLAISAGAVLLAGWKMRRRVQG